MSKQEIEENPPCPLCEEPMSTIIPDEGPCNKYSCRKHGEFNEATLCLPKKLLVFLRNMEKVLGETMENYLGRSIIGMVAADLNTGECFVPSSKQLVEEYGLEEIFKVKDAYTVDMRRT